MLRKNRFDLSVPQHTAEGRVVSNLFYGGVLTSLLIIYDEYDGCPHDGGSHTLYLYISKEDLRAFFDLIDEIYLPVKKYNEGIIALRARAMEQVK